MMQTDVAVIGSGPAGIQAAIHASRKKVSVVILGRSSNSAMHGTHIENYFGIGDASGDELLASGIDQAERFGCVVMNENVMSASRDGDGFLIGTESGETISARAVVIATGISRVKLGVPGEKELLGKGVSYCASCDCNFYKGKIVAIIGNESEAAASAELMTKYASEVFWLADNIGASQALVDRVIAAGVKLISERIVSINGDKRVESVTTESSVIKTDGVFIELGAKSSADLAMELDVMPEIDDTIKVGRDCSTETKGVYACGDVTGKPWQVGKAVGEGVVAGTAAANYVRGI